MDRGIHLRELSESGSSLTSRSVTEFSLPDRPKTCSDHPVPQSRGGDTANRWISRQMLSKQSWAKVVIYRLSGSFKRTCFDTFVETVIGSAPSQSMDDSAISVPLCTAPQSSELPTRNPELPRPFARSQKPLVNLTQHSYSVSVAKTQCQHLLPRADRLDSKVARKRTFLFLPKRTFLFECYRRGRDKSCFPRPI